MKIPNLSIELSASVWIHLYLLFVHCLLFFALTFLVRTSLIPVLLLLIFYSAIYWFCRYQRTGNNYAIQRVDFNQPCWFLQLKNEQVAVQLETATVLPWLVVMVFRCSASGCRYELVLFPDSVDEQQFRRLRVMLKHMSVYRDVE